MKCGLFLNVVIRKSATILQLLAGEDQTLLIWWDSFFVLDLGLDVINRVRGLDVKSNRLAREGLDENLHASPKAKDKMKCGLFLNVVIRKSATILQLLAGEDQTLLIWWDSLFVLDLGLDVINRVRGLD